MKTGSIRRPMPMDDTRYKIPKIESGNESEVSSPIEATDDMDLPTGSSLDLSPKDVSKMLGVFNL